MTVPSIPAAPEHRGPCAQAIDYVAFDLPAPAVCADLFRPSRRGASATCSRHENSSELEDVGGPIDGALALVKESAAQYNSEEHTKKAEATITPTPPTPTPTPTIRSGLAL